MTKEDWIFSTFVAHMQSSFFNSFASLLSLYDLTMPSICIAYKLRFLKNLQYEKSVMFFIHLCNTSATKRMLS